GLRASRLSVSLLALSTGPFVKGRVRVRLRFRLFECPLLRHDSRSRNSRRRRWLGRSRPFALDYVVHVDTRTCFLVRGDGRLGGGNRSRLRRQQLGSSQFLSLLSFITFHQGTYFGRH